MTPLSERPLNDEDLRNHNFTDKQIGEIRTKGNSFAIGRLVYVRDSDGIVYRVKSSPHREEPLTFNEVQ